MTDGSAGTEQRRVVWGALAMIGSVLCFTLLDTINKILVADYSPFFLSWARSLAQVLMMLAVLPLLGGTRMFRDVAAIPAYGSGPLYRVRFRLRNAFPFSTCR